MSTFKLTLSLSLIVLSLSSCEAQIPNKEQQIASAVMAAPEEKRADATVMGYNDKNELVIIKLGTNELICLADDPQKEGYNSSCYHKDLEPFMARGRELQAEGKSREEIFDIRAKEAEEGKLILPKNPATLHVLSGANGYYDAEKGEVVNANLRYVVYIPYATQESTGLPIRPLVPGGPWIMDPGTHRAHIMVTPPVDN
ncbi:hypothetical protein [Fulvivirga lutea]|uniref:Uncharacterized protein n=1 Tax=Fulvivirga lutea TaxID=2810512 RepID=A0A974WF67_9BACT|nr:hypothetical protein [Fulvivirga lutea]QSE97333.1 hypothetical protein JR347_17385 [Fulvivirga lutea]